MNKVVTSIKLPESIEQNLLQRVISDKYGMRGKSKWVIEAIEAFLVLPNFIELVNIASEMEHLAKPFSIRLPADLIEKLDQALIEVRKRYPEMEGVRSNIIRASIMQRLLRGITS